MQVTKIAIADDQRLFRKGMISLLHEYKGLKVILEAEDGQDLIQKLTTQRPDIVLLDLEMPKLNGIETLKHIRATYPKMKVLILTMHNQDKFILHTMEMGANGFLMKDAEPEEVLEAIEQTMTEGDYFSRHTIKVMRDGLKKRTRTAPSFSNKAGLTDRELEVVQLTTEGLTAKQVGEKLFIHKRTVEGHRRNILEKIGANNIIQMIVYAVQHNLVDLDKIS
ncbi:hypothetical protein BKI52_18565 [marine bacterium AO1-C]|nr:hypothetical protein BKI52_18565 [marine bacterium AO1-C]